MRLPGGPLGEYRLPPWATAVEGWFAASPVRRAVADLAVALLVGYLGACLYWLTRGQEAVPFGVVAVAVGIVGLRPLTCAAAVAAGTLWIGVALRTAVVQLVQPGWRRDPGFLRPEFCWFLLDLAMLAGVACGVFALRHVLLMFTSPMRPRPLHIRRDILCSAVVVAGTTAVWAVTAYAGDAFSMEWTHLRLARMGLDRCIQTALDTHAVPRERALALLILPELAYHEGRTEDLRPVLVRVAQAGDDRAVEVLAAKASLAVVETSELWKGLELPRCWRQQDHFRSDFFTKVRVFSQLDDW